MAAITFCGRVQQRVRARYIDQIGRTDQRGERRLGQVGRKALVGREPVGDARAAKDGGEQCHVRVGDARLESGSEDTSLAMPSGEEGEVGAALDAQQRGL